MPDQADELRKLVAETPIGQADIATTVLFEGAPVTLFNLSESGAMISTHAGRLLVHPGRLSRVKHTPDKAKLWDDLSADLERWVRVGGFDKPNLSTEALAEFWEMMQRRKEQA